MKFHLEKIPRVKLVWTGPVLDEVCDAPGLRGIFMLPDNVSHSHPDVMVGVTTFNKLEVIPDITEALQAPYCLGASGLIRLGASLVSELGDKECDHFDEAMLALHPILLEFIQKGLHFSSFKGGFSFSPLRHANVAGDGMLECFFAMTIPTRQEVWMKAYELKSLELTAATRYFQYINGSGEETITTEDISGNRSLN